MGPLEHQGEGATDEARAEEAKKFLAASPARQLVAELLERLRKSSAPWWSAESLRAKWPAFDRMSWLATRPDLRQKITSRLTGLAPKAARKKAPDFQAGLIDSVLDEGDIDARELDQAFSPEDLAVYGPIETFWRAFREALPMDAKDKEAEELAAWLLDALLAGVSGLGSFSRAPILTPLDVRLAIDGTLWQTKLPVEVRVAIDRARLAHEKEQREPRFGASDELAFATSTVLAKTFTLRELEPVLVAAEKAMGFVGGPPPARVEAPAPVRAAAVSGPPPSSIGRPAPSPLTAAMMQASSSARPARGSVAPVPPPMQPLPPRSSSPPLPPPPASAPPPSRKPASVAPLPPPPLPVDGAPSRASDEFAEVSENELEPTTNPWEPEGRDTPQDDPDLLHRPRR